MVNDSYGKWSMSFQVGANLNAFNNNIQDFVKIRTGYVTVVQMVVIVISLPFSEDWTSLAVASSNFNTIN